MQIMKKRTLSLSIFCGIILSLSFILTPKSSIINKQQNFKQPNAWAYFTRNSKGDAFAMGVAGTYISTCWSVGAAFAWGGPAGIAAGVVAGL